MGGISVSSGGVALELVTGGALWVFNGLHTDFLRGVGVR
jgi:hypothetical protein